MTTGRINQVATMRRVHARPEPRGSGQLYGLQGWQVRPEAPLRAVGQRRLAPQLPPSASAFLFHVSHSRVGGRRGALGCRAPPICRRRRPWRKAQQMLRQPPGAPGSFRIFVTKGHPPTDFAPQRCGSPQCFGTRSSKPEGHTRRSLAQPTTQALGARPQPTTHDMKPQVSKDTHGEVPGKPSSLPVGGIWGMSPDFFFPFHIPYTPRAVWEGFPFSRRPHSRQAAPRFV